MSRRRTALAIANLSDGEDLRDIMFAGTKLTTTLLRYYTFIGPPMAFGAAFSPMAVLWQPVRRQHGQAMGHRNR